MNCLEEHVRSCVADSARVVILGAGSVLKADDAAGMLVIEKLTAKLSGLPNLLLIAGSTAPENFTGVIKAFHPDHIFIVDAAHLEEAPGTIGVVEAELIGGLNFSTHMLPFSIMINYLEQETGCTVSVIGIQPLCTEPGAPMTEAVLEAVAELADTFTAVLQESCG